MSTKEHREHIELFQGALDLLTRAIARILRPAEKGAES
jgi:hypothetical protein